MTDNTGSTPYSATNNYLANSPLVGQITFANRGTTEMTIAKQYDYLTRLRLLDLLTSALACGFAACSSCSNRSPAHEDPMVPLGLISGERELAAEQRELVSLLRTNGIEFGGGGSKVYEIDVPASKFDLSVSLLRTNRLVIQNIFVLSTNASGRK